MTHVALYGNVKMLRTYCRSCGSYALIVDRRKLCCGEVCDDLPTRTRRMSEPYQRRERPKLAERRMILSAQENRCFYCDRMFGCTVIWRRRHVRLRLEWEHLVPFCYNQNNGTSNFVAACHVCNHIKAALMFQTIEEARLYVTNEIEKDRAMRSLSKRIPSKAQTSAVLQPEMPDEQLD